MRILLLAIVTVLAAVACTSASATAHDVEPWKDHWKAEATRWESRVTLKLRSHRPQFAIVCYPTLRMPAVEITWKDAKTEAIAVAVSLRDIGEKAAWEDLAWGMTLGEVSTAGRRHVDLRMPFADTFIERLIDTEELAVALYSGSGEVVGTAFDIQHLEAALASEDADWDC